MLSAAPPRRRSSMGAALDGGASSSSSAAAHSLSFYREAPNEELTLEDFEVLAFSRLKLLREIDSLRTRGAKGAELNKKALEALKTHVGRVESDNAGVQAAALRSDLVGHHILRLAYCNTDEKRKWFLAQEGALFRARFEAQTAEARAEFCVREKLRFVEATRDEYRQYEQQLEDLWYLTAGRRRRAEADEEGDAGGGGSKTRPDFKTSGARFFKVRFTDTVELLRSHQGFLAGGWLFIESEDLKAIVAGRFRSYLSQCLALANKALPAILRDERLAPMLTNMSKAYAGPEYGTSSGKLADRVTADDVDALAASAFPLCMQNLHNGLKQDHHLRHGGRMQYGLYLKGVGLNLEDALVFWQREFTKKMTPEAFLKNFAYNIRHNYGKEGKRVDYGAYSCTRILNGPPPGAGEYHGCPYRHFDLNQLRGALGKTGGLSSPAIDSVLEAVRSRDFQVACRRQFEGRFPGVPGGNVGNHPNAYADEAREYLKKKADAAAGGGDAGAAAGGAGAGGFSATSAPAGAAPTAPVGAAPAAPAGAAPAAPAPAVVAAAVIAEVD